MKIANLLSARLPQVGGTFLQTEDEISAVSAAIGASWAGCKALTATSGPGISLMLENIGFAAATETPLVNRQCSKTRPVDRGSLYRPECRYGSGCKRIPTGTIRSLLFVLKARRKCFH